MSIVSTSTGAFFERARSDMKNLRTQAEGLQAQLSSGTKLDRSSDNPVAASRLRALDRLTSLSSIDAANAGRANSDLTLADAAMSDMTDALVRAQELASQAATGTTTDEQRSSIATELDQIHGSLLSLANARDSDGHALFGGESAGDAYQLDASGNAVYVGTPAAGELPLGEGQSVTRSMTGPEFLGFTDGSGNTTDLLATIKGLADALKGGATDPASAARDALGTLQTGLDTLTTGQTVVGTRLAWIELTTDRRSNLADLRSTEQADLGATDVTSTIARLQETLLVLEASQSSFGKLSDLSLFSMLH